jgi:hypothetical protein
MADTTTPGAVTDAVVDAAADVDVAEQRRPDGDPEHQPTASSSSSTTTGAEGDDPTKDGVKIDDAAFVILMDWVCSHNNNRSSIITMLSYTFL